MIGEGVEALEPRLVRELLDILMLQVLSAKPRCGYEVIAVLQRDFGVMLGSSKVYPLLHRLDREGYVRRVLGSWRGRRKVYALTPQGLTFLNAGRDALRAFTGKVLELGLVKPVEAVR